MQTSLSQQPQQTGFLAQHPPGKSQRQVSGRNPFLQYMSPHAGDQQRIAQPQSPRRNPFLQHMSLHAGDQQRMPQQQTLGGNSFLRQMSPHAGDQGVILPYPQQPAMGSTLSTTGTPSAYLGSPSPAGPSTFRRTLVPGSQP